MTEAELVTAIQGNVTIVNSNREYALTVLTGYVLILHFMGGSLTRFQISFVTAVYSLVFLHSIALNYGAGSIQEVYRQMMREQFPEFLESLSYPSQVGIANEVELLLGLLVFIGSILFMWSVRHPKTE